MSEYVMESSSVTCDQGPTAAVASLPSSSGLSTVADGTVEYPIVTGIVAATVAEGAPRSPSTAAAGLKCEDEETTNAIEAEGVADMVPVNDNSQSIAHTSASADATEMSVPEGENNTSALCEGMNNQEGVPAPVPGEGDAGEDGTKAKEKDVVVAEVVDESQPCARIEEGSAVETHTEGAIGDTELVKHSTHPTQSAGEAAVQRAADLVTEIDASGTNQGNEEGVPILGGAGASDDVRTGGLKNDLEDTSEDGDTTSEDGMEEMTEEEEKSAMLNIVLSELLRKFREENGRGPNSQEVLEIRASVAEQLEIEVATTESLAEFRPKKQQQADGKKRPGEENTENQPSPKKVKFEALPVSEEEPAAVAETESKPPAS